MNWSPRTRLWKRSVRENIAVAITLTATSAFLVTSWWMEWYRFSIPELNYLAVVLAVLFLAAALGVAAFGPSDALRIGGIVILAPLVLVLTPAACVAGTSLHALTTSNHDPRIELIQRLEVGQYTVSAFRTNYEGALGDFGILIRRERRVAPGLFRVKRLYYRNPGYDVYLRSADGNEVSCQFLGGTTPEWVTLRLDDDM